VLSPDNIDSVPIAVQAIPSVDKRTFQGEREYVATDPERHFATINYRIAKGSFACR